MTAAQRLILAAAVLVALAAGFIGGAYNSYDYWKQDCGIKISDDLLKLGFKPGDSLRE
jgi:hypothetical protein